MDKTNYVQALMHMIKGNLGAGLLAMPASFSHLGLVGGLIGLPTLCFIAVYCVQLLLRSAQQLESGFKGQSFTYASLAKHSFKSGPSWLRRQSNIMCRSVDAMLLITQLGVCCVYIVFVVDNIISILATYKIYVSELLVFLGIFPIILSLSCIRTLNRLSIASTVANLLQAVGLSLIMEYLLRDFDKVDLSSRDNFMPIKDMALGFGSAMFAFEGISVVMPVYSRLKKPNQMISAMGVVNVSFLVILCLYFIMGVFGYLKFGHNVRDSITLSLPPEPLYDAVRAMFTASIVLSYPLQFYVPNEIIWGWIKSNLLTSPVQTQATFRTSETAVPKIMMGNELKQATNTSDKTAELKIDELGHKSGSATIEPPDHVRHEYCCRTLVVLMTFSLAYTVPHLNLLMDLVGSLSGTVLSLTLPAIIHLATFWNETKGINKALIIFVDMSIICFSLFTGASGSIISLTTIMNKVLR